MRNSDGVDRYRTESISDFHPIRTNHPDGYDKKGGTQQQATSILALSTNETTPERHEDWDSPCYVMPREQIADELLVKARDDANSVQIERKQVREDACRIRVRNSASSARVESLTSSIVHSLLRLIEQFKIENTIQDTALSKYLDQRQIPKHGHDKTIYTRVARCVGKQTGRSLRNKIADNLAGAQLLGVSSAEFHEAIDKGVQAPDGEFRHGVSALGIIYRKSLDSNANKVEANKRDANQNSDEQRCIVQSKNDVGSGTLSAQQKQSLMRLLSSPRVVLRVSVGRGRETKVRRVRCYGNRIVFSVGPSNLKSGRPKVDSRRNPAQPTGPD